jgi:acetoin utilization deacetylase AcuC-like enzyme
MSAPVYIAYDPIYAHPLPEGHRFPMLKYELIPGQLLHEGTIVESELHAPVACEKATVLLTHGNDYVQRLLQQNLSAKEQREIGFPQSPQLTKREFMITQGTINCSEAALANGIALNVAGGTHHAFADKGEGFCLLNDFAIAANYLLSAQKVKQVLIIDLDVHQGNGTAKIFEHNDSVFTFSMHGAHNYPFRKEKSDWDIGLADGTDDATYLSILETSLQTLMHKINPGIVFYLSGVDVLASDKYGKLKLTLSGCMRRDEMVFRFFKERNIPVCTAMGGGYSPDVRTIVEAHCNTFRVAKGLFSE